MKSLGFLLALMILVSCRPERVDVRDLTPEHRALFAEAAATEGVDTTIHGRPGDWTVEYGPKNSIQGVANNRDIPHEIRPVLPLSPDCEIRINPHRMHTCGTDNVDTHFKNVVRHELGHCQGKDHNSNPNDIMGPYPPCGSSN